MTAWEIKQTVGANSHVEVNEAAVEYDSVNGPFKIKTFITQSSYNLLENTLNQNFERSLCCITDFI